MKILDRRLQKLENGIGRKWKGPGVLVIVDRTFGDIALDESICISILDVSGHLETDSGCTTVDFNRLPAGLGARETETFLREHGAELTGRKPDVGKSS